MRTSVYFCKQQQTFPLRKGESNQQGAAKFFIVKIQANCCGGRRDTDFIIRFNYSERNLSCLNMCSFLHLAIKFLIALCCLIKRLNA